MPAMYPYVPSFIVCSLDAKRYPGRLYFFRPRRNAWLWHRDQTTQCDTVYSVQLKTRRSCQRTVYVRMRSWLGRGKNNIVAHYADTISRGHPTSCSDCLGFTVFYFPSHYLSKLLPNITHFVLHKETSRFVLPSKIPLRYQAPVHLLS